MPALESFAQTAEVDLEAERREAYDEGHQAATEAMMAQHAEALEAMKEQHAKDIEQQRLQFEDGLADYLSKALPDLALRVSTELSEATVRVLSPLVKEQVMRGAVHELVEELKPTLAKEILEQVTVFGPAYLCDLLKSQLEERGDGVSFVHTEDTDIRVEIGDSLLVTRLSAFAADLERVLA
jgi:restriction endonuclease Mrr